MFVNGIIDEFKQRQVKIIERYTKITQRDKDVFNKMQKSLMQMHSFCLAMNNYFTLPKVIVVLQEKNIGVVLTSRFRINCPSKDLRKIQQEKVDFNDFFYCIDRDRTLIARWVENGIVFCVWTIHMVDKSIQRTRKNN